MMIHVYLMFIQCYPYYISSATLLRTFMKISLVINF